MMKYKFNINDLATVRLTNEGIFTLHKFYSDGNYEDGRMIVPEIQGYDKMTSKFVTELWDLFRIFGPRMSMTSPLQFELNAVIIDDGVEEKMTSEEWSKICKVKVRDEDGWDRKNFDFSWHEELITRKEFEKRLSNSTCSFDYEDLKKTGTIWLDDECEPKNKKN